MLGRPCFLYQLFTVETEQADWSYCGGLGLHLLVEEWRVLG